ncbi:type II secretion system ATPase GspE [Desulfoplanes sp.]
MVAVTPEEYFVRKGRITPEDVAEAHAILEDKGGDVGRILVEQKKLSERELLVFWSEVLGMDILDDLGSRELDYDLVSTLPIQYAKKHLVLPYAQTEHEVLVVIHDPLNSDEVLGDLHVMFAPLAVTAALAPAREILSAINRVYGQAEDNGASEIIQDLDQGEGEDLLTGLEEEVGADLLDETSEAPIIKLVNHILAQAVKGRASDIHIEPYHHELHVRFRLDGVLYNKMSLSRKLHSAVVSRIKIMAKLNIAEKRLPQDGRIEIRIGDRQVDLRVSTIPTAFGERVVMRLLEKGIRLLTLEEIGLPDRLLQEMYRLITLSHGIVLVTGPTGSGKTTTLYAALNHINSPDKNILTIEDPIEYQLDGIGQMQVASKIDLTFARGLRAMVRQDPDVILVGEIRDLETAEIAIQAALTGHLVFSTLHTNDAASAVTRLIDMGIEPFLVSSSVRAIIAQRLVRKVCPECRRPYEPTREQLEEWGLGKMPDGTTLYKAGGCPKCLETGYKGRTGIYEFLHLDEELASLILQTSDANQIRSAAVARGMSSLRQSGMELVARGETTVSEILRVTQV